MRELSHVSRFERGADAKPATATMIPRASRTCSVLLHELPARRRLHFSGSSQAAVSVNNDPTHFDTKNFDVSWWEFSSGQDHGWWNPPGDAAWRLIGREIIAALVGDDQPADPTAPIFKCSVADADSAPPAKLVDLDPVSAHRQRHCRGAPTSSSARRSPTGSMTSAATRAGSRSGSTTTPPSSRSRDRRLVGAPWPQALPGRDHADDRRRLRRL